MNEVESRIELEGIGVGQKAWENNFLSQEIDWREKIELSVLAEDVVFRLTEREFPPHPFDGVYFEEKRNDDGLPSELSLFATWNGVENFWNNGEVNFVSFESPRPGFFEEETSPIRKLTITGFNPEETTGTDWRVVYEFNDSSITKQTSKFLNKQWVVLEEDQSLDKADYLLTKTIFINMSDKLHGFVPMDISDINFGF